MFEAAIQVPLELSYVVQPVCVCVCVCVCTCVCDNMTLTVNTITVQSILYHALLFMVYRWNKALKQILFSFNICRSSCIGLEFHCKFLFDSDSGL